MNASSVANVIDVIVALFMAAILILGVGGISCLLAWVFIQELPKEDQPKAWQDFVQAWGERLPYSLW